MKPRLGTGQLLWVEPYEMIPARDASTNQPSALQNRDVLRDGIQGETMSSRELRHARLRRRRELPEQTTARSVAVREEEFVKATI